MWLLAGDTHTAAPLVGLTDVRRAGGEADAELVARWLDDGITPSGVHGYWKPPADKRPCLSRTRVYIVGGLRHTAMIVLPSE